VQLCGTTHAPSARCRQSLFNAKPSFIGQSKTDRVRVIGNAFSHAVSPSVVLDSALANANRMFALQTANRDLQHPRK